MRTRNQSPAMKALCIALVVLLLALALVVEALAGIESLRREVKGRRS